MAEAGRLFHTVIVVGAAMTAPCCGADQEVTPAGTRDHADAGGQAGMGSSASGTSGSSGESGGVGGSSAGASGGDGSAATGSGGDFDANVAGMTGAIDAGEDAASSGGSAADACAVRLCEATAKIESCGDCQDNDFDGKIDVHDSDCSDACDTLEGCPTPQCRPGVQACGVACLPPCPAGYFCFVGCCGMIA